MILKKYILPVLALVLGTASLAAGPISMDSPASQIINVEGRNTISLDGWWKYVIDPQDNGIKGYRNTLVDEAASYFVDMDYDSDYTHNYLYDFSAADSLKVPGDWNTQKSHLMFYEGTIWYRKRFEMQPADDCRYFLYFGAANYEAMPAVNGETLGKHIGGYTPFNFEVTGLLRNGLNSVVVRVNNTRSADAVPTVTSDWWNYGGLTRNVCLIKTPKTFIRDYYVHLDSDQQVKRPRRGEALRTVTGWVQLDGEALEQEVSISLPELESSVVVRTDRNGYASFSLKASPELYGPSNPRLYEVVISSESDEVKDRIGFRTIKTEGKRLLLNGEDFFWKGVNMHCEYSDGDSTRVPVTEAQAQKMLGLAEELGCNGLRLAHYPHSETYIKIAEEKGLMVWSEIPNYWSVNWDNPLTYANAENQLQEMITRDKNRANVLIWCVGNENRRTGKSRDDYFSRLIDKAREMDGERLVTMAMERNRAVKGSDDVQTCSDPMRFKVDLMSLNDYFGSIGDQALCYDVKWTFDVDKPVFISEFGVAAPVWKHGTATENYTQERMDDIYSIKLHHTYPKIDGLVGVNPWQLTDARSPRRMCDGISDGFSRAGLVSSDGVRKNAFNIVRDWYGSCPCPPDAYSEDDITFIHITDPQLGFQDDPQTFPRSKANFEKMIGIINQASPDFVVITGDLIDQPSIPRQREAFDSLMHTINSDIPVYLLPGNHDVMPYNDSTLKAYIDSGRNVNFSFECKDCAFIGFDSNCIKYENEPEKSLQLEWLKGELAKASDAKCRVLFTHCPIIKNSMDEPDEYFNFPTSERKTYLDLCRKHKVAAIFCGHTHKRYETVQEGILFSVAGPVGLPLDGGVSGYNVVTVRGGKVTCRFVNL